MISRVYRCALWVPVNNPRLVERAWTRRADAIILDLEDSVPMSQKEKARSLVHDAIPMVAKGGASVFVRINKEFIHADLNASVWPGVSRVLHPKTESSQEVQLVDALLTELEKQRGIRVGSIEIYPLLESALGVVNAHSIATSSQRVKVMGGGIGYDMAANLEIEMDVDFDQYVYSRSYPYLAALVAGVEYNCAPYIRGTIEHIDQPEGGLRLAAALHNTPVHEARVLHPAQVEPLVSGLTPTQEEVDRAKYVIQVYEDLLGEGKNVAEVDGDVVDIYEYHRAMELLQWAAACAVKDRSKAMAIERTQAAERC